MLKGYIHMLPRQYCITIDRTKIRPSITEQ